SLAEAYHAEVFDPLGLGSTFFAATEQSRGDLAIGHSADAVLDPADLEAASSDPAGDLGPGAGGGLVSTAADVTTFAAALFRGELLSPALMRQMLDFDQSSSL